jgi:hypothetical protein
MGDKIPKRVQASGRGPDDHHMVEAAHAKVVHGCRLVLAGLGVKGVSACMGDSRTLEGS